MVRIELDGVHMICIYVGYHVSGEWGSVLVDTTKARYHCFTNYNEGKDRKG
jgi:hypothetical protein